MTFEVLGWIGFGMAVMQLWTHFVLKECQSSYGNKAQEEE